MAQKNFMEKGGFFADFLVVCLVWMVLGVELRASPLNHSPSRFLYWLFLR
jgi:hypothetical protein